MDKSILMQNKNETITGMIDYLNEYGGESYSTKDVAKIGNVLDKYFANMEKESKRAKKDYKKIVKDTVIKLNKINSKCDESIIETDQRESICDYIINTAILFGFIDSFKDITEEWREW